MWVLNMQGCTVENVREGPSGPFPCMPESGHLQFISDIPMNGCCRQASSWLCARALLEETLNTPQTLEIVSV